MKKLATVSLLMIVLLYVTAGAEDAVLGNTNANILCDGIAVAGDADTIYFVDGGTEIKSARADEETVVYEGNFITSLNFYDGVLYFIDDGNIMTMPKDGEASIYFQGEGTYDSMLNLLIVDGITYFRDLGSLWRVDLDGKATRIFKASDWLEWFTYADGGLYVGTYMDSWDNPIDHTDDYGLWRVAPETGEATRLLDVCVISPVFSDGMIYCTIYDGNDAGLYRISYDGTSITRLADGYFIALNLWNDRLVAIEEDEDDHFLCLMSSDYSQKTVIEESGLSPCVIDNTLYYLLSSTEECKRIDLTEY